MLLQDSCHNSGASLVAWLVKNPPWLNSWVRKNPWRRDRLPTLVFLGFLGDSDSKESACNAEDLGSTPGLGSFPREGHGNPLHYSCLENSHGQRSLWATVHRDCKESDMTERLSTGIKPMSPAVEPQSPNHWTAREFLVDVFFSLFLFN